MNEIAEHIIEGETADLNTRNEIRKFICDSLIPVSVKVICRHVHKPYPEASRAIRLHVQLLVKSGMAIQSSDEGYSIIKSTKQLNEARKRFRANAIAAWQRYNQLEKNYYSDKTGVQLTFEEFFKD